MSTTVDYKYGIDLPEWRALSQPVAATSTSILSTNGVTMASDMRCRNYAHPHTYFLNSNTMYSYNNKLDAWQIVSSAGTSGTFGQGATSVFCPTLGQRGTIGTAAGGNTTTRFALTTALTANVIANQLANRGDGLGFIVRVIGNAAGSSGKIEERRVVANTAGSSITVWLDKPLSFTPASGDTYEFLSGSVMFLNTGTTVTGIIRRYDILTNSFSSPTTTGMLGTIAGTHNQIVVLDEQYVPFDRNPGEGQIVGAATYDTAGDFTKGCLTATGSAAGTLTGQAASGDATVVANQYRNYQIRIVEDTAIPTAVGQRRRITQHTAGASPVYTLANNWTVTPSTNCKFVIENDSDRLIFFFGGQTATYNYFVSNNTNITAALGFDTSSWAARSVALGTGGLTWHSFGIKSEGENTVKSSNIISFRGGSNTYDVFDIAGGATGTWTNGLTMLQAGNSGGDSWVGANDYYYFAYNPHTQEGAYMYTALGSNTSISNSQRAYVRFNSKNGVLEKVAGLKMAQGATNGYAANISFCSMFQDGTTKVAFYNTTRYMSGGADYYQLMLTF